MAAFTSGRFARIIYRAAPRNWDYRDQRAHVNAGRDPNGGRRSQAMPQQPVPRGGTLASAVPHTHRLKIHGLKPYRLWHDDGISPG